jgi:hypothetical protein
MRTSKPLVALWGLLLAAPIGAAESDPCTAPESPPDLAFELSIAESAVFQQGAPIPLRLSFATTTADRYLVDPRWSQGDRRSGFETYCVEPAAPDPLDFYEGVVMGPVGASPSVPLDPRVPFTMRVELNEWRTLVAGRYRVFVVSRRLVSTPDASATRRTGRQGIFLRSNVVELEVRSASKAWVKQQIQKAAQSLAPASPLEEAQRGAHVLRFLNTVESTRALAAAFLSRPDDTILRGELLQGLYGSPYRDLALSALKKELAAPTHPIREGFLSALVTFEIASDPAWRVSAGSPGHWGTFPAYFKERTSHSEALKQAELHQLASVAGRKRGAARATSLATVLQMSGTDQVLADTVRPQLIADFGELSEREQTNWLALSWPLLRSPQMLPVLLRLAGQQRSPRDLRNAVLRDLYDLDPRKGRELILGDLVDPDAEPTRETIDLLPHEDIVPALEPALARIAYARPRNADYLLVEGDADVGALAIVNRALERSQSCSPQAAMLRYLLRVDPDAAAKRIEAVLQERERTHCYATLFQDLKTLGPTVEPLAIAALDDPSLEVAAAASRALSRWGSSGVEAPLWARLQRVHDESVGKEESLEASFTGGRTQPPGGSKIEANLVAALLDGVAWTCGPEKMLRLLALASTSSQRNQINSMLAAWARVPVEIREVCPPLSPQPTFWTLQYQDISQSRLLFLMDHGPFPKRLLLRDSGKCAGAEATYETLRAAAERDGLALERAQDP